MSKTQTPSESSGPTVSTQTRIWRYCDEDIDLSKTDSNYVAIDFETYYDDDYDLADLSPWSYVNHPKFDPYIIAIYSEAGSFCGPLDKVPAKIWKMISGRYLINHNAGFDSIVWARCAELGLIPKTVKVRGFVDSADLAAYLHAPRNLKGASHAMLGIEMDKTVRTRMKNKTYAQALAEGMGPDLHAYALSDAVQSYQIFVSYMHLWPEFERVVSEASRLAVEHGFAVDIPKLDEAITSINNQLNEAETNIPWDWEGKKTPLSPNLARLQCRQDDIPAPSCFNAKDEKYLAWELMYAPKFAWIKSVRDWRRLNMLRRKLASLRNGLKPDGTFSYSCKYYGAERTGRFSGAGESKFNVQNLLKETLYGVNLRNLIIPRPGKKLVSIDFAQIEARLLHWVVGDVRLVEDIKKYGNLYEAYARKNAMWTGEEKLKDGDFSLYNSTKAIVLGSGFQCGWRKLQSQAATTYSVQFTDDEAENAITTYREQNPLITNLWYSLHAAVRMAANHKEDFVITLPSGRELRYFDPQIVGREITAMSLAGKEDSRRKVYGGLLTENMIQALARDVLVYGWSQLRAAGMRPLFTVHDEYNLESDEPEQLAERAAAILRTAPPWAKDAPLDVEWKILTRYEK